MDRKGGNIMTFKRKILIGLCSFSIMFASFPAKALICELWDILNAAVTPLPTNDTTTGINTLMTNLQQVLQSTESLNEYSEYLNKFQKLASGNTSLASGLQAIDVKSFENATNGASGLIDAFKGKLEGLGAMVNFEKPEQVENAVNVAAVVSNPIDDAERLAEAEKKAAFIQQSRIDLLAEVLVAKKVLAELKAADSQAQTSSSSQDTNGIINQAIQMKNFENQVQVLEQQLAAMQDLLEGIRILEMAEPVQEEISVGGKDS